MVETTVDEPANPGMTVHDNYKDKVEYNIFLSLQFILKFILHNCSKSSKHCTIS